MAAGATYEPIATQTLGSAASSVTFSSISGSYTDLILMFNGSGASGGGAFRVELNTDIATNYSSTYLAGDGTTASSGRFSNIAYVRGGTLDSGNTTAIWQFQNYSNTTTNKTSLARYASLADSTQAWVGLWRSTAAINSIKVFVNAINFNSGSTFTLYGIKAA
jgi:hypothetical protein